MIELRVARHVPGSLWLASLVSLLLACAPRGAAEAPTSSPEPEAAEPETPPPEPSTAAPVDADTEILGAVFAGAPPPDWAFADRRASDDPEDRKKKPFTIEALYQLRSVGAPRFSPDGRHVLFTVASHDLAGGKTNVDLYLADTESERLRRMTHHPAADASPLWSPDGRSFLFVSTRKDGAQLWRMQVDGGEAEQLTHVETGVSDPVLSPDGRLVAFTSSVFPEHGADQAANAASASARADNPIQAHVADELLYRHWTAWDDGRRNHVLVLDLETDELFDATPGDFHSPSFSLGDRGYDFAPDSRELCFVSNRDEPSARAWTTNKDLYVVGLSLGNKGWKVGKPVNLTDRNEAYDGSPLYSPDGRYIAYRRQEIPGYESDRMRLALYDRQSGKTAVINGGFDDMVDEMVWTADSAHLVFHAPVKGRSPLFRIDVKSGAIEPLALPSVGGYDLGAGDRVAFTATSVGRPAELYVARADGSEPKRLTGLNDDVVAEYDIRPVEEYWVDSPSGKKIHTFVVKPHGFRPGKKYPAILNVHGGPQSQWSDALRGDWQVYPGAGYVVVFANPHGSTGYGQDFTLEISQDWGGKVYQDVMAVADAMEAWNFVDPARIGAMGWSYGGYMMNWILGHTNRFAAIASMMGIYDLDSFYGATEELWFPEFDLGGPAWSQVEAYRKWSPAESAARFETPTLVITGELDYRVPYTQSLQLFTALRRQDVPARLIVFPNDGHWPSYVKSMPLYYAAHLDWFHRYLGGAPSPWPVEELVAGTAFADED